MIFRRTYKPGGGKARAVLMTAFFLMGFLSPFLYAAENTGVEQERDRTMETALMNMELQKRNDVSALNTQIDQEVKRADLKNYESELLRRPKKKYLRFGYDTDATYSSNRAGSPIHYEQGNTGVRTNPSVSLDLSKRKTDLRLEYRWNRLYNNKTPGSDSFSQELSLRAGRKISRKTTFSLNERLTRNSVRVVAFDNKKINLNIAQRTALSYEFNPKLSFNFETNYTNSVFTDENFDEQGTHDFQLDPSFSFQPTRKSRITGGYQWSNPRSHTETSDVTNHVFRSGYNLKITPKSSASVDFTWTLQDAVTAQASNSKKYATSASYIWQATKKTSIRLLYSNSYSYAISDSVSGRNLLKTVSYSASNTWGTSFRFRALKRLNTEFSFNPTHNDSKTITTGSANTKSRSFTFPIQVGLDVDVWRGIRLRFTYTYRHKIGDEMKTDENRTHTWFLGTNFAY